MAAEDVSPRCHQQLSATASWVLFQDLCMRTYVLSKFDDLRLSIAEDKKIDSNHVLIQKFERGNILGDRGSMDDTVGR